MTIKKGGTEGADVKPKIPISKWSVYDTPLGKRLTGIMEEDHHTNHRLTKGVRVYTSLITDIDLKAREIETLNTIYVLVGDRDVPRTQGDRE